MGQYVEVILDSLRKQLSLPKSKKALDTKTRTYVIFILINYYFFKRRIKQYFTLINPETILQRIHGMSLPEHHFATDSQNPSKEQLENLVTNSSISIKYHPHYYKYLQPVISSTSSSTPDSGRPACLVPIIATHPTEGRTVAEEGDSIHVEERERMRVRSIDGARHKPLTRPVQVRKRRPRYPTPVDKKPRQCVRVRGGRRLEEKHSTICITFLHDRQPASPDKPRYFSQV